MGYSLWGHTVRHDLGTLLLLSNRIDKPSARLIKKKTRSEDAGWRERLFAGFPRGCFWLMSCSDSLSDEL